MVEYSKEILQQQFKALNEKHKLTPNMLDNRTAYGVRKWGIFTLEDLAILFGCSKKAIQQKEVKGEEIAKREGIRLNLKTSGETLQEVNAVDTYTKVIKTLADIANAKDEEGKDIKGLRTQDMIRACEALARLTEPKIVEELQTKYESLNGLINFILSYLIPEADKRVRQLIKEIQYKVANNEDVSQLQISLRMLFKELLPKVEKLYDSLKKDGWLKTIESVESND